MLSGNTNIINPFSYFVKKTIIHLLRMILLLATHTEKGLKFMFD